MKTITWFRGTVQIPPVRMQVTEVAGEFWIDSGYARVGPFTTKAEPERLLKLYDRPDTVPR